MRSLKVSLLPLASNIIASSVAAGLATREASESWPIQTYETVSFESPQLSVTKSGSSLANGLIFFTPAYGTTSAGNIITDDGVLVWSTPPGIGRINNLRVQQLNGKSVLTFWNGTGSADPSESGHGFGSVNILDDTYTEIYRICPDLNLVAPNGLNITCGADIHESYITDRGSILVTAYNTTTADLTSVGGPENGYVWDSLIFEIDIKMQKILFRWSALENIPVSDTHVSIDGVNGNGTASSPFDWCHLNSIQPIGNSYLINSRHLWASYLVGPNGTITWAIKGDNVATGGGTFKLSQNASFSWQHNARIHNLTNSSAILSYFDNHNSDPPFNGTAPTSGKIFSLDFKAGTATLLKNITDVAEEVYADSQGSFTPLSNGNYFQGFGQIPLIKEFGSSGDRRLRIQFGNLATAQSYRAFRREWNARPAKAPDVVAKNGTVYVSWNGATNVTDWSIYTGQSNTTHAHFKRVATIPKTGFETSARISGNATLLKVAALASGTFLRESAVIQIE